MRRWTFSLFSGFVCLAQAFAQTGSITGVVVDQVTREPLAAANIQVVGTSLGAAADVEGRFVINNIPVGTYQLRGSLVGYEPALLSDVIVESARPREVMLQLDQVPIGVSGVEVTASYFPKDPDAVVSVQKLSNEEIRRSPGGFEDVVRAISVLPGVSQAEPGRNDLVVRGGAPSENLFLLDNIEIPNINHFGTQGAGGGPLSYVNVDFIRETAFTTGGFGVRYGDKLSSVMQIDLRDGRTDRLGAKATISASQFGLNLEGPLSERSTFIFSARRSYLDLIFKAAGFSFVPEYWDFLGRANFRVDPSNTISFLGIGAIDDVSFFNDDAKSRFDNSRILGTAQRQYASGGSWQHLFSKGFSTVTLSRSFITYNGVQRDSLLRPVFSNRSTESETGLKAELVLKLDRGGQTELSAGTSFKRVRFNNTLALPRFVSSFGDTLRANLADAGTIGYKSGTYVQISQHLPAGFQATAGMRMEYFSLITRTISLAPRLALTWSASPLTTVSASVGRYTQAPSYIWLASTPENRALEHVRADQAVLGVEHLVRPDLKLRVEAFLKRYSRYPASVERPYLVLANTGGGFGGSDENFASFGLDHLVSRGTGRSFGIEFLAQKKLSEIPLYGLLSLTWSASRATALDGVERAGAFDQPLIANLTGGYRFDERWEASMKFRFAAGRPYTPFRPDGSQEVTAYNSARVTNAHSLDLRVDRRWNFSRWALIVYVDIQNIYNNKFSGSARWNAREQRVEMGENAIGILPSIGISAEV